MSYGTIHLHRRERILSYKRSSIKNVKWKAMSYGTITSNGAAMDQDAKPPNEIKKLEQVTLQTPKAESTSAI